MEITDRWRKLIEHKGHNVNRKTFWGWALAIALLATGAGVSRAQDTPAPPAEPQISPGPRTSPLESPQAFVLSNGSVHLGVTLDDVTAEKAQKLKLPAVAGAIVTEVQKDSAAAKAGIESGDVIIAFDGVRVRSSAELRRLIRETPSGRTVEIKIVRGEKTRTLSAELQASPKFNYNMPEIDIPPVNVPEIHIPSMDFGAHRATLGISGDGLTPQLAQYFGVKQGKGVLIAEVTKGGPADKAGLKAGDVIVQVGGESIGGVEELRAALDDNFTDDTRKVSLTIVRDHHEQTVNAELTRFPIWERRTSNEAGPGPDEELAQTPAGENDFRALAQRARVQAEVMKQQQQVQAEWQRQLRDQMSALKDQLKQMQNVQIITRRNGEI
jgi:serine protease Do